MDVLSAPLMRDVLFFLALFGAQHLVFGRGRLPGWAIPIEAIVAALALHAVRLVWA